MTVSVPIMSVVSTMGHDADTDIWYECVHHEPHDVLTWSALPPND